MTPAETPTECEALASIEHDQWIAWSKDLASKETLSPERLARWRSLWVPYEELSEEMKEHDRRWARLAQLVTGRSIAEKDARIRELERMLDYAIEYDGFSVRHYRQWAQDRAEAALARSEVGKP